MQKIITYCQRLRWEPALPRWTHTGRSSSSKASWWEHCEKLQSSSSCRRSKWEMFLQTHHYLVKQNREALIRATTTTTCCFLFLLSAHSLPTSASFPQRVGAVNAVEVSVCQWMVLVLQVLQVQCSQTSQTRRVPTVSAATTQQQQRCFTTVSPSHKLSSFPTLVSVCAPLRLLHYFLAASVVQPLQADFLSSLPSFYLCRLHLLQTCVALCTALRFQWRIYGTVCWRGGWGCCGLLSFNAHSVDVCTWLLSGGTISLWPACLSMTQPHSDFKRQLNQFQVHMIW